MTQIALRVCRFYVGKTHKRERERQKKNEEQKKMAFACKLDLFRLNVKILVEYL